MTTMQSLRHTTDALIAWPWSRRRRIAVFVALEDLMALQINRVMSMSSMAIVALEARIAALEAARDLRRDDGR